MVLGLELIEDAPQNSQHGISAFLWQIRHPFHELLCPITTCCLGASALGRSRELQFLQANLQRRCKSLERVQPRRHEPRFDPAQSIMGQASTLLDGTLRNPSEDAPEADTLP